MSRSESTYSKDNRTEKTEGDDPSVQKVIADNSSSQLIKAESGSTATNITQVAGDFHEHHYYPAVEGPSTANQNLPSKSYHRLIGRQTELSQLKSAVLDPENKPVIAIVGLGGIGKTALAREVAEWGREKNSFEHIVWISFKMEYFIGERIISTKSSDLTFDLLLSEIARQCGRAEVAEMKSDQRYKEVKSLLANERRSLIIIDNLETVRENEVLVVRALEILGKSKLILTTRHHLRHERVYTIELMGLSEDEGIAFLREEGKERGVEAIATTDQPSLKEIHSVTGGAPLAMKLVVGQISRQPFIVVLNTLKEASHKGEDYDLYSFIYRNSWEILETDAQMVLVDIAIFPPVIGGSVEDVEAVSQVKGQNFWTAMDLLVTLSLVEKIGNLGNEHFFLHPLTQYFIRSDITKEWIKQ